MKKGFTLIELLAVIVILAIIALIAIPIILDIIGDTKKESDKRSIEMYGDAIKNAVAKSMLDGTEITPGNLSEELLSKVEYDGSKVECDINKLYSDGNIYLAECMVNDVAVEYTYGEEQKHWYYSWTSSGNIGDLLPDDKSITPPENRKYYFGIDSLDGENVSEIYICLKRNDKEYCLKGADATAYEENVKILREAFSDVAETEACHFGPSESGCSYTALVDILINSDGFVSCDNPMYGDCTTMRIDGSFGCEEYDASDF